ncbi:MAG: 50S ribosomal protein L1 [Candidatus Firestonebacteria bacterium]
MFLMGKRIIELKKLVDGNKKYLLEEGCCLAKKTANAKFDETVNVTIKLGIDVKQTSQAVRGNVVLPHGTGKIPKVLVFVKGEKEKEAKEAGADFVGAEDLMEKISGGWRDFDVAIATPDMMKELGKIGKILGPLGLMPNPKTGTVTYNLAKTIKEAKTGRIEFKTDVGGMIYSVVGKSSFEEKKLIENASTLIEAIVKNKPSGVKGTYIQKIIVSSTMGPGINIDVRPYVV